MENKLAVIPKRFEKPRTLVEICTEGGGKNSFVTPILGEHYCGVKITRPGVDCPFRDKVPSRNGLYGCGNMLYTPITMYKHLM